MRILLVSSQSIPHVGGLSTHFQLLERTLGQSDALFGVVTGGDIQFHLMQTLCLGLSRLASADVGRAKLLDASLKRLSDKLQLLLKGSEIPDLIHCHDALACVAACNAVRSVAVSVPVVQTVHGPASREALMGGAAPGGAHVSCIRRLEQDAFGGATQLIAVDHGQADILAVDFHVPPDRITVIANGIDVAATAELSEGQAPLVMRERYFLVPRRLVKKNGVEVALRAIARLDSTTVLAIAGDGPLRRDLERIAAALNIVDRVRFLGKLPPAVLLPLMRRALGVVIPSVPVDGVVEATSLAALEGMACGTPILVSDIGGLHEIVSHADVGFLSPAGDEAALASTMRGLEVMPAGELAALRHRTRLGVGVFDVHHWSTAINTVYRHTLDARNALA
jgi:glycosyltransferase involved in cell wall biosynthesis